MEHDGEHHQEHIVHLVKIMSKTLDRSSGSLGTWWGTHQGHIIHLVKITG
jgi:hypothetical protein